jgi:transposase
MRDRDLYGKLLGVGAPWAVRDVLLIEKEKRVEVYLEHKGPVACPECGGGASRYDSRERRWRHLDTLQFQTVLVAEVPRSKCDQHGVKQVQVPWGEPGSRFTALFEALVIDWLQEASLSAVARLVRLTWDEVDGIMGRAVARGLARRKLQLPTGLTVDETAFQRGHEYVTVVGDLGEGTVLHVADGRTKAEFKGFLEQFPEEERAGIDTIAMDMWPGYIEAVRESVPGADDKIAFDRFHVAKHLGEAVDRVRRQEAKALASQEDGRLKKTRYLWLTTPANLKTEQRAQLEVLRRGSLKTARAWALKEEAAGLWHYRSYGHAERAWLAWYGWAIRSRLEPVKTVARMVKRHLFGILNAVVSGITNAKAEGLNSAIQWVKYTARGFRNRERFRNAIYFHLGGLDLYPATLKR